MFLIEWKKGAFVNGELVDSVTVKNESVVFTMSGDIECSYTVDNEFQKSFVNNLQAIDENGGTVERAYNQAQVNL